MWRAIIYGCVPVTYFRAVELPFMRRLGIDYGQFSVNIQPDDFDTTQACFLLGHADTSCGGPPFNQPQMSVACPLRHARPQCIKLLHEGAGLPRARVHCGRVC